MAQVNATQQYLGLISVGDFLLDFRPREKRKGFAEGLAFLKFQEHVAIEKLEFEQLSIGLSSVDDQNLWGPCVGEDIVAVVVGRIDLEEADWRRAEKIPGQGGLASKFLAQTYRTYGARGLDTFSGNFALLVWDRAKSLFFVVTDLCGAQPVFETNAPDSLAFGSHPDSLAICVGEERNWDEDSLTEFLLTSVVTPPNTFYKGIRSLQPGVVTMVDLRATPLAPKETVYFSMEYRGKESTTEEELAEELAKGFVSAVNKRTLPRLGPVAVALSGGLDSRTILAAARDRSNMFAFCCFDAENFEFRIAKSVADALGVKLAPLTRNFDYYGDNAELGIRIAGGMGTFANNHFLGVSRQLRELGAQNFLTGCYCDYLFKGLPLNTVSSGPLGRQTLGDYRDEFYFTHYRMDTAAAAPARERLAQRYPEKLRNARSAADVFELEKRRTIPLFQEGDNSQRLVPQRVLHSYLPVADRALIETYCKIPYQIKLNRSVFKKAVEIVCGPKVTVILDANTGAPANAGMLRESLSAAKMRAQRKIEKLKPSIACQTSWPDWGYYVANSEKLKSMWQEPCAVAEDFFKRKLPAEDLRATPGEYSGRDTFLFVQLLSLKIWFSQRG